MAMPVRALLFSAVASVVALAACGRSALDDGTSRDAAFPALGDDAQAPWSSDDATDGYDAYVPPINGDAGTIPEGHCDLTPPLAPGCPPVAPLPRAACVPPTNPSAACTYALTDASGTYLASYVCGPLGEDLIGWKESVVPCTLACRVDAGATPLDTTGCASRETVPCNPPAGESVQEALRDQIFTTPCQHRDGAGGYTVRFDPQGCAISISGGLFSACDVVSITSKRFLCAEGHPCATAVTLVK